MRTVPLVVLLAAGVVCAGAGAALGHPWGVAGPEIVLEGSYQPLPSTVLLTAVDPWQPLLGDGLLALGAGTSGAAISALLVRRRPSS